LPSNPTPRYPVALPVTRIQIIHKIALNVFRSSPAA
jgi:hypothetical protein